MDGDAFPEARIFLEGAKNEAEFTTDCGGVVGLLLDVSGATLISPDRVEEICAINTRTSTDGLMIYTTRR